LQNEENERLRAEIKRLSDEQLADLKRAVFVAMTPEQASDYALPTPDGKSVRLSDYRDKAVLLNFFGDTCEPCLEESPWLVDIQARNAGKGF
jgi:thiol-disulfide isomerase/thioredoxin